mmetsp:Transcript_13076/g.36715  ORF Transcript_13076/g.36715 Transcript_13076/m.36715 type:complete len:234 (+) Transcript_13076:143-844(+)
MGVSQGGGHQGLARRDIDGAIVRPLSADRRPRRRCLWTADRDVREKRAGGTLQHEARELLPPCHPSREGGGGRENEGRQRVRVHLRDDDVHGCERPRAGRHHPRPRCEAEEPGLRERSNSRPARPALSRWSAQDAQGRPAHGKGGLHRVLPGCDRSREVLRKLGGRGVLRSDRPELGVRLRRNREEAPGEASVPAGGVHGGHARALLPVLHGQPCAGQAGWHHCRLPRSDGGR